MFDVGFWEIALIGVIGLLILGPERLPRVARTAGHWVGRARRFVNEVKSDISAEIEAEDLANLKKMGDEIKSDITETGRAFKENLEDDNKELLDAINQSASKIDSDNDILKASTTDKIKTETDNQSGIDMKKQDADPGKADLEPSSVNKTAPKTTAKKKTKSGVKKKITKKSAATNKRTAVKKKVTKKKTTKKKTAKGAASAGNVTGAE